MKPQNVSRLQGGRELGGTRPALRLAAVLRGHGAAVGCRRSRRRRAYRSLAVRRSRAMARPPCVAARASSRFARDGAHRLGTLGGMPVVASCDRGAFAGRSSRPVKKVESTRRTTCRRTCRTRPPWPPGKDWNWRHATTEVWRPWKPRQTDRKRRRCEEGHVESGDVSGP